VVGDMDSLPERGLLDRVPPDRLFVFPVDKDETDTEIGMRFLRERGCTDISLAGGGGGRIDHLLGVALLFERDDPPSRWLTDAADIYMIQGERVFTGWEGSTVSVFPLGSRAARMTSEGLRWPLDGLEFRRGYGGISNVATGPRVRIGVGIGRLLVVRSVVKDR
jgi:thiamine pyrophosphokinase